VTYEMEEGWSCEPADVQKGIRVDSALSELGSSLDAAAYIAASEGARIPNRGGIDHGRHLKRGNPSTRRRRRGLHEQRWCRWSERRNRKSVHALRACWRTWRGQAWTFPWGRTVLVLFDDSGNNRQVKVYLAAEWHVAAERIEVDRAVEHCLIRTRESKVVP